MSSTRWHIGRAFIRDIPGNTNDAAIATAVAALAHSMQLSVVADSIAALLASG